MASTSSGSSEGSRPRRRASRPGGPTSRPGQAPPDRFGIERQQRGRHPAQDLEHRGQGVEGVLRSPGVLAPSPEVPQNRSRLRRMYQLVRASRNVLDGAAGAGQVVAVHGRGRPTRPGRGAWPARSGRAPRARRSARRPARRPSALAYREKKYQAFHSGSSAAPDGVGEALLLGDEVAAAQHGRGEQVPAHGVGPVLGEHGLGVGVVAQPLGHLQAVVAEHDAVGDAGLERRPVEQGRGQDVQGVEPAPRLADVLHDEVAGEVARRTTPGSRRGSAPGRTASSPTRTSSRARRSPGAWWTGRSDRRGWAGSARRSPGGAGRSGARRSRARARRGCRRRRCAGRRGRRSSTPGSASPRTGCGRSTSPGPRPATCRTSRPGRAPAPR